MRTVSLLVGAAIVMVACATSVSQTTLENSPAGTDSPSAAVPPLDSLPGYIVTYDTSPTVYTPAGLPVYELADPIPGAQPTFSPDGSLAWTARDGRDRVIRIRQPDGTTSDFAPPMTPFYYFWSPDGTSLAFLGRVPDGQVELVITDRIGEEAITDRGSSYFFDWAPDSRAIAAHVGGDTLRIYSLEAGPVDRAASSGFGAPQWPDERVAWLGETRKSLSAMGGVGLVQTARTLFLDEPNAAEPIEVAEVLRGASFSIAANRLALLDGIPIGRLLIIDGESVVEVGQNVVAFQWNPDGSALAWLQLFHQEGLARWLVWTPEQTLTFERFAPTPQFVGTYLPFWDQYIRSQTMWAPDGTAFVYGAATANGSEIFVQSVVEGAPATAVASGGFASWGPVSFAP